MPKYLTARLSSNDFRIPIWHDGNVGDVGEPILEQLS